MGLARLRLDLAPAAAPVVGDDLVENASQRRGVDRLALRDCDRASRLVVVPPCDDPFGVRDEPAVVEKDGRGPSRIRRLRGEVRQQRRESRARCGEPGTVRRPARRRSTGWKRSRGTLKRRRLVPMDNSESCVNGGRSSPCTADDTHDASMDTTDRISTPEAAPEERPREADRPLIALMIAVAGLTTAAWAFALVVLAGWLIAGVV